MKRQLIFENGQTFVGDAFGADAQCVAPIAVHTAMVGYQELITDPKTMGHMALMTYPLIGNYGLTDEDDESRAPCVSALIVREYNGNPTNYRYTKTLGDVCRDFGIPGLSGVDTRKIARMLRQEGPLLAMLADTTISFAEGVQAIRQAERPRDLVRRVSCQRPFFARTPNFRLSVAVLDLGVKRSAIQQLNQRGCNVTVVPYDTRPDDVLALCPDGVLLPDGPGEAADVPEALALARALFGRVPLMGIGLGLEVIALARGARLSPLSQPHRGANHPVRDLGTSRVEITAQNHAVTADAASLAGTGLSVSHVSLIDGSVEGIRDAEKRVLAVQFSPESAPGHAGAGSPFDQFAQQMTAAKREDESDA